MKDECYIPDADHIALQSEDNKQGRMSEPVSPEMAKEVQDILNGQNAVAFEAYHKLLDMGIAREIARVDLPLSLYTEFYWQIDLHNLFHFLALRLDGHAQYEIRAYAEVMLDIVRAVCPIATEAFENHKIKGRSFSGREVEAIKAMLRGEEIDLTEREKELFEAKLK
jgi:thymidylate synthase (FAD)